MPADEVTHGTDVEASRVRTGPRHAAPKKPLFTRFHVPAGKAIALAAMPTAVLMGMGFTPTLALADDQPASKSLTADEYKDCLTALEDGASPSASPSPSASASGDDAKDPSADGSSDSSDKGDSAEPDPSASSGGSSSSDSGSDDKTDPAPSPSASSSEESDSASDAASPSPSESGGGLLDGIGDAIGGILTGDTKATDSASPTPSATPSASASPDSSGDGSDSGAGTGKDTSGSLTDTTKKLTDTVGGTVKDTTDGASKTVEDTAKAVEKAAGDAADGATASPGPSAGSGTNADDCPAATDEEGGQDEVVLPDNPWYLDASSLLLRKCDYKGVVTVKTASGQSKKVLKYVVSGGIDIGDLHQTVYDKQSGKTHHVQAAKGSMSTFRGGKTVMYTESISGKLFGLIPMTFSPDSPPPLNIPEIYFTDVKVVQAGQAGGTLHIPGLHNYLTG
ncbi:hypothetical protein ABZ027_03425 [Streptomyces sp. NPDC006332]|uniref:hypothetical protein n=1 Tax=Streptomyces sp. NPDC006332 TaxID=3155456 RepID=UPI0033BF0D35